MVAAAGEHAQGRGISTYHLRAGDFEHGELVVVAHRAREALSAPFAIDVTVRTDLDAPTLVAATLGKAATLSIGVGSDGVRTARGIVSRVRSSEDGSRGEGAHARMSGAELRIVPRMWLLRRRKSSRIFQDKSVPQVIHDVLGGLSIPAVFRLERRRRPRAYCVQYEETDFDFVARLAAEEGIFFYFPDTAEGLPDDAVVFGDSPRQYARVHDGRASSLARKDAIAFRDAAGMDHAVEAVLELGWERNVRETTVTLRDYDFEHPTHALEARATARDLTAAGETAAPGEAASLEIYEHHGEYEEPELSREHATVLLARARCRARLLRGESSSRRLVPGHVFALEEHPSDDLNREYVVVRVRHTGHIEGAEGHGPHAESGGSRLFRSHFDCAPSDVLHCPRPKKRKLAQVLESAIVVGPANEEIYTDEFGRVKVQFHWDREGQRNESSSCWIRVVQRWAGSGFGSQFVPRIGMEVLVSFLGGDVDRPVIVGCTTNQATPAPFGLPGGRTRSGFRTRSTPRSQGYNELSFDDAAGSEQIYLRAERDLAEEVRRDHEANIERDQRTRVARDSSLTIGGERRVEIGGGVREIVGAGREVTTAGDVREITHGATSSTIAGDHAQSIGGGAERTIGGGLRDRIGGDEERVVEGSRIERLRDDLRTFVAGHHYVNVGTAGDPNTGRVGIFARNDLEARSGGVVRLVGKEGISLQVDGCSIDVTAEGIRLAIEESVISLTKDELYAFAKSVRLIASDQMAQECQGAFLKLSTDAELTGNAIALHAQSSSLDLDSGAQLRGLQIKLDSGHSERSAAPERDPAATKDATPHKIRLVLADDEGKPYASKNYILTVDGEAQPMARTGGDGSIEATVPSTAVDGRIDIEVDEDERVVVPLHFAKLPAVDTVRGAKARLRNIGHYDGPLDDVFEPAAARAVKRFQRSEGLPDTGALDRRTLGRLTERAG